MSFDLYVLDLDVTTSEEVLALLAADETTDGPLTPKLVDLVRTLEERFPGGDDEEFDESPWSSWPLDQPVLGGRGCAFNIRWSMAPETTVVLHDLCLEKGLRFYDVQNETLVLPQDPIGSVDAPLPPQPDRESAPRKWWRRRG